MKIKIAILAPFPDLCRVAEVVIQERAAEWVSEIKVVQLEPMAPGVVEAEQEIAAGAEVIISRGYTGGCIAHAVDVPVVQVPITAFDIIQALQQLSDDHRQVGIIGFPGVTYECEKVGELLGISIRDLPIIDGIDSMQEVIKQAVDSGFTVVMGGVNAARIATGLGIKGIVLKTGKNSMYKAIKEAEAIAIARRKELKRADAKAEPTEGASPVDQATAVPFGGGRVKAERGTRQKLYDKGLVAKTTIDQFVGVSPAVQELKHRARKFARTDSTILITGESGTGKELLAQSIHNLSKRQWGPFVAVNCGALPESLLESELFGYEQGAFTGAKKGGKVGLFELAHGGTLFLDEVGEMPLALQSSLLRVLQEKAVMRLGSDCIMPIDVRVIAATNQDLEALIEKKTFRKDLYYRLNVLRLYIPPLRERLEDIPDLVQHILRYCSHINPKVVGFSPRIIRLLQLQDWDGNIRELSNALERAMLLAEGPLIGEADIEEVLPGKPGKDVHTTRGHKSGTLQELESEAIIRMLVAEKFSHATVAAKLGISRTTLWRRLKELGFKK